IDAYGSPAFTPAELGSASEPARVSADMVSAAALGVGLVPAGAGGRRCEDGLPNSSTVVPPQGLVLVAHIPGVQASLRRYATQSYPVALGPVPPNSPELLRIEPDRSVRPWRLQLSQPGVSVCQP
ncbi:MAG TPA: hypothetical protein VHU24_00570, partial [Solirubrobacterales bacterium]|nr:hypothetical protein [Solirubrobacterales bacterium]